jgi:hypothetical protein
MNDSRGSWFRVAFLAGTLYLIIGRVAALPGSNVRVWRLAAWLVSLAIFCAHIGYEHFKLRAPSPRAASHVAVAVAIGSFGLAVMGMVNSLSGDRGFRGVWMVALIAWPAITAIPAFIVALIAVATLRRLSQTSNSE